MNKIKNSILLIITLCISFSNSFSQVNDNIITDKVGTSSFSASIWRPLLVHNAQVEHEGGQEYVRGAVYNINDGGSQIKAQYTVHGEVDKFVYFIVSGSPIGANGIQIKDDGQGVKIKLEWKVSKYTTGTEFYSGSGLTPYKLKPQTAGPYGALVIWVRFMELDIDANATPGTHVFEQTITVGYNPTI